jgi:hypothetical protein
MIGIEADAGAGQGAGRYLVPADQVSIKLLRLGEVIGEQREVGNAGDRGPLDHFGRSGCAAAGNGRVHGDDVGAITHGRGSGECGGNLLCDVAGRGPFGSALKGGNEADAAESRGIVPKHGMEDSSLPVVQSHQDRLVMARACVLRLGVRCRQYCHVFARAAQGGVEFVGRVHPHRRQTLEDGMLGLARRDLEWTAHAVRSGASR